MIHGEKALDRSVRGQLVMLLVQLLVGMAVNILGVPAGTRGATRIETSAALAAHLLVAVGLLAGSIVVLVRARGHGHAPIATRALGAVVVAFGAGVLDLISGSDWWSYLMAASATAAIALYGVLLVRLGHPDGPTAQPR